MFGDWGLLVPLSCLPEHPSDLELRTALSTLLHENGLASEHLVPRIRALEQRHGKAVYSEVLHLLAHLRFDAAEAEDHWERIFQHRLAMRERLAAPVDLRVALLDYFVQVNRKLTNPKIIELKLFEKTEDSVLRDELTGLYNYRYFSQHLPREIARSRKDGTPLSLVMIDIDNFKEYNDRNGHDAGNVALAAVGRLLTEAMPEYESPIRYGGEEFVLVLPSTPKTSALEVATRVRESVERHRFPCNGMSGCRPLTVSIGIATCPGDAEEARALTRCADHAMYVSKTGGKNRVWLYGGSQRSYRRTDVSRPGAFRTLCETDHPATILNVSEGGLLLLVDRKVERGALVEVDVDVAGSERRRKILGRVVRVLERHEGRFEVALVTVAGRL
jgi:diguanylate cyclase (GGDEF)-like protein